MMLNIHRSLSIVLISAVGVIAGCKATVAAPAATENAQPALQQRVVGTLTRKGSEFNAWWALSDAQGKVWRLQTSSAEQAKQFEGWQNKRVEISGIKIEDYLATEQLRVNSAQLAP
jgi:hypothetical protein